MATSRIQFDRTSDLSKLSPAEQKELLAKLLRDKINSARRFPMSYGQQGLWHAFRRNPHSTAFNVFLPTRIRSSLDIDRLRKSINLIALRHAALRTTFSDDGGKLVQQVHHTLQPDITVEAASGTSEAELRELLVQQTRQPFDLESGPLLRVKIYQLAADDFVILALTHHIVTDFWSLVLIFNELRQAYPALARGATPDLPVAVNNYHEFVREQQLLLDGPTGQELRRYWLREVQQATPVANLPTDYVRPRTFSERAKNVPLTFSTEIAHRLSKFAAEHHVTPVAVVQAAVQVLIQRYTGQDSFFIGSPFSGRQHSKYEATAGFFVNMLPLKANLQADPTFVELSKRVSATLVGALEHEAYPISLIASEADIPRDPSRSPLFQVSCTFEKSQLRHEVGRGGFLFPGNVQSWDFGGLRQESFYVPWRSCHYDLEFIFEQSKDELRGMLCYCSDLFSEGSATFLAENFTDLLSSLLQNGHRQISRIAWNDAASSSRETAHVLAPAKALQTVDQLLVDAAKKNLSAMALISNGHWLTYEDLLQRASRIASQLGEQNVQAGDLVPLLHNRSPASWVAMLGVLQAGAGFIPLDASQPAMQLSAAGEAAKAKLALVSSEVDDWVAPDLAVLRVDNGGDLVTESTDAVQQNPTLNRGLGRGEHAAGDLAYVVFTSGSTGTPKGVMLEHSAVCNTLHWRMRDVPLHTTDRVLMLLSHQFDAGLGIAWSTLTQGAALVLATEADVQDPQRLIDLMVRERVTVLPAPPSLLSVILDQPRFSECAGRLRQVWTGGEAMPPNLPDRVRSSTDARFVNFYGPTEAAIEATFYDATEHEPCKPVPIGKAIDGTEILILDSNGLPVARTVPGEIAIGGAGLARGYLNDPSLTSLKFVPHPCDSTHCNMVYLTGDRGRIGADGNIEFLGRTDHQVKLRGYRLELGEIETVLESHPDVIRAAAKVSNAETASAQLLAYAAVQPPIQDEHQRQATTAIIHRYLREQLPAYKVPAGLMLVETMPLTTSGKVDRGRLPDFAPQQAETAEFISPTTPLEEYLAQAWCQILERQRISTHWNFFDAGGSSLQAAMLTTSLSQDLGIAVPTALLFDLADITQLAHRLVELHPEILSQRFGADCIAQHQQQAANPSRTQPRLHELLVPLRETGSLNPLFMVHPPGGIVVCYRELAQYLGEDQPVYGIRSRGLHGEETLPSSLTEMARDYLQAIRSVQPQGGIRLGGWSLGGLVAYEIAQQLRAAGEPVDQLLLLDTTIPSGATQLVPEAEQVNVGLEYGIELTLDQLGALDPEEQLPYLWEHAKNLGVVDDNSPSEVVAKALAELQGLFHHHVMLARGYPIEPIDVDILLIRPSEVPFELKVSKDRGWRYLTPNVQVHFVPGHHHNMVQSPNVQQLAALIAGLGAA